MKGITRLVLLAAVLSSAVSIRIYRDNDSVRIETSIQNPETLLTQADALADAVEPCTDAPVPAAQAPAPLYRIRNSLGDAASQLGAYSSPEAAIQVCPPGYCVFDPDFNVLYTADGA